MKSGIQNAFDFPGFVPAYIRPLFCEGRGPFRWVALSGDEEDIFKTDNKIIEMFPNDKTLTRWYGPGIMYVCAMGPQSGPQGGPSCFHIRQQLLPLLVLLSRYPLCQKVFKNYCLAADFLPEAIQNEPKLDPRGDQRGDPRGDRT